MTREEIIEKVKNGKYTTEQLIKWLQHLPKTDKVLKPAILKRGDVLFHHAFGHPVVIIKKKKASVICCLLTSKELETTIPANSRFFPNSFISKLLVEVSNSQIEEFQFRGVYDNPSHLKFVHEELIGSLK